MDRLSICRSEASEHQSIAKNDTRVQVKNQPCEEEMKHGIDMLDKTEQILHKVGKKKEDYKDASGQLLLTRSLKV